MRCLLLCATLLATAGLAGRHHRHPTHFQTVHGFPGAANCTTTWFPQRLDHYSFGAPSGAAAPNTFQQRVLTYDKFFRPGGPIFFYAGNEGPIEAFANIAGLMWQNAQEFGAALIFAEHRFYGETQPCQRQSECWEHLSTMQAMADYAVLLTNLTDKTSGRFRQSKGVITFGGSYGGMLSAWMRMKFPNLVTGSIASSAPIRMVSDAYAKPSYWNVITDDAKKVNPHCAANVHKALTRAQAYARADDGRPQLSSYLGLCGLPNDPTAAFSAVGNWVQAAFDILGMGDYPYSLDFMFGTRSHPAPAWPMKVACGKLNFPTPTGDSPSDDAMLFAGLRQAVAVMYNVTQDVPCFNVGGNPTSDSTWDYMVCSEGIINEQPYFNAVGPPNDMFWAQPVWDHARMDAHCRSAYNLTTRYGWLNTTYGAGNVGQHTNIVFANGLLDPWHSGGILWNVSETVRAYIIPEGAHHLDLLFTVPQDPPGVAFVRSEEARHIRLWLSQL